MLRMLNEEKKINYSGSTLLKVDRPTMKILHKNC